MIYIVFAGSSAGVCWSTTVGFGVTTSSATRGFPTKLATVNWIESFTKQQKKNYTTLNASFSATQTCLHFFCRV